MKVFIHKDGKDFYLTNEGIKVGDRVYSLLSYKIHNEEFYLFNVHQKEAVTGFPHNPATITEVMNDSSTGVREFVTNHGRGPCEIYFKLISQIDPVEVARSIAEKAHANKLRRGGKDYFSHLEDVSSRVSGNAHAEVVAWLHDVLEKTMWSESDLLYGGISQEYIDDVIALTKKNGESYADYLKRVAVSEVATRVKVADILSNLSDDPTPRQIRKYAKALSFLTEEQDKLGWK